MYYAPYSSFALGNSIAPVAEWFRALIIRPFHRYVWCEFESNMGHMRDKQRFSCRCVRWFFSGFSPFSPHLLFGQFHMSRNNDGRDVI